MPEPDFLAKVVEIKDALEKDDSHFREGIRKDIRKIFQGQNRRFLKSAVPKTVLIFGSIAVAVGLIAVLAGIGLSCGCGYFQSDSSTKLWEIIALFLIGAIMTIVPLLIICRSPLEN